jgi:hypothetical protein
MKESFAEILTVGGKSNSLGRANEVIDIVLSDNSRLEELYNCLFEEDAWVRMRAADCLEKVCRQHPEWIEPYIDKFLARLTTSTQPSIQWHLAQIFEQVYLTNSQRQQAIKWLMELLSSKDVDWIVSANCMDTLAYFTSRGEFRKEDLVGLLKIQQQHHSKAVVKRANKFLDGV